MKSFSLLILALLLTGCALGPQKTGYPNTSGETAAGAGSSAVAAVLPEGPVTPNPYLHNPPSVSRAVQQQFDAARAAMQQQQWPQAEHLLVGLARDNPSLSGVHLNLGLIHRAQGNVAPAEAAFAQAIKVNDTNLDAYNQLAILKRQSGDFAGAEQLYLRALKVWPFHASTHKNLAILYDLYLGREQQALAHYRAYEQLVGESDKQLKSWIADLQRRLGAAAGD